MRPGTPPVASLLEGLRASLPSPRSSAHSHLAELLSEPALGHRDAELTAALCARRQHVVEEAILAAGAPCWEKLPLVSLPPALLWPTAPETSESAQLAPSPAAPALHVVLTLGTFWVVGDHRLAHAAERTGVELVQLRLLAPSEELPTQMPSRAEVEASRAALG